ncbi:hypothetical protein M0805_001149 [Coniferiporia weirii]|nr:hypothetical protein M0805_001149 [Coniferiporia weirii]
MLSIVDFIARIIKTNSPPTHAKLETGALRCGILGAARIAPDAIMKPAKSHPEFIIYAVAARDKKKAEAFASKHDIPKAYSGSTGYQDMLDNPEIDVVYNPLPNGLHYEWTFFKSSEGWAGSFRGSTFPLSSSDQSR